MLVWSNPEAHRGIARFLGFYANQELSEAWLLSPWEPYGNVGEFIRGHNLEVPEKLSLVSLVWPWSVYCRVSLQTYIRFMIQSTLWYSFINLILQSAMETSNP